jgi:hypothetical protein
MKLCDKKIYKNQTRLYGVDVLKYAKEKFEEEINSKKKLIASLRRKLSKTNTFELDKLNHEI